MTFIVGFMKIFQLFGKLLRGMLGQNYISL